MVPEISHEEMAILQAEDSSLGKILQWLEEEQQPSSDELWAQPRQPLEVRNLWAQRPQVHVMGGLLVRQFGEFSTIQFQFSSVQFSFILKTNSQTTVRCTEI